MKETQTLTITLTPDEIAVLKMLTEERGFDDPAAALHGLLQDAIAFYNELWIQSPDPSQDILEQLADDAHQKFLRGETK